MAQIISAILDVVVKSPEGIIYDGKVEALSSINQKGPFDILPFHENFISIIQDTIIIHETKKQQKKITFDKGILKVFENTAEIFLGVESV